MASARAQYDVHRVKGGGLRGRALSVVALGLVLSLLAASFADARRNRRPRPSQGPPVSGAVAVRDVQPGTAITECPQAGLRGRSGPLDRRARDEAEQISRRSDDIRVNQDYSCFPHNETSVAVNPRNARNLVAGANDYRLAFASSGFYATTDAGRTWYDGILPFPSLPDGDNLDGGGDPAITYDREGVAYYAEIAFNRTDDTNGIFVMRSTNGGFTWTRACVPISDEDPPSDEDARCGGVGDPRLPGDGVVSFQYDDDTEPQFSVAFDDKEYIAAGPRPSGVAPRCFAPVSRAPETCDPDTIGSDRLYVVWTRFEPTATDPFYTADINLSYSDDQGRSWSPRSEISLDSPLCVANDCFDNQFAVPTVHPRTGLLGVGFQNYNTPAENQYLFVRSTDGGQTFEGPHYVSPIYDVNFPLSGFDREDCRQRGLEDGREVLTNSCFRMAAAGNVVVDKRSGEFRNDFYVVLADNRNGTRASTNADVFFLKSSDGGRTWIGPTRVNDDRSVPPDDLNSDEDGKFGNDQFFSWVDVNTRGELAFGFSDRRLDTGSTRSEWPTSRSRSGNYLVWFFGAGCRITRSDSRQCLAPAAARSEPVGEDDPVPGQGDAYRGRDYANQRLSDVGSNWDYTFRAGIFAGDYHNVAYPNFPQLSGDGGRAIGFWTDARNGRSSGGPAGGPTAPSQPGRNPICEQSDVFAEFFDPLRHSTGGSAPQAPFLVTPCPEEAIDSGSDDD